MPEAKRSAEACAPREWAPCQPPLASQSGTKGTDENRAAFVETSLVGCSNHNVAY